MPTNKRPFLLLLLLFQCSNPKSDSIEIIVKNNEFLVNGTLVEPSSLERKLQEEKSKFGDMEPIIILKVDRDTKRGKLADLETILRRLNMRKIRYHDLDDSKSG